MQQSGNSSEFVTTPDTVKHASQPVSGHVTNGNKALETLTGLTNQLSCCICCFNLEFGMKLEEDGKPQPEGNIVSGSRSLQNLSTHLLKSGTQ